MLESLFNKVTGLQAWIFIQKILQHRCFPVSIAKFLRTPILKNICKQLTLEWLLPEYLLMVTYGILIKITRRVFV